MNLKVAVCSVLLFCFASATIRDKRYYDAYYPPTNGSGDDFTKDDLDALVIEIRRLIDQNNELIPDWVQLSFHDCFGKTGCDGCLDRNHPGNLGLLGTVDNVDELHSTLEGASKLSKADFIALLGTQAAKAGAEAASGTLDLPFSVGRKDCSTRRPDTGLPVGHQLNTISLLKTQFSLDTEEAVALIGAHSLGRARKNNTGFSGPWDRSELRLDTGYYRAMTAPIWNVTRVDNDRIKSSQWTGSGRFLMLHADMIILKKFSLSGEFREPNCRFEECPDQNRTAEMVRNFQDQPTFHEVFSRAYLKMITKSDEELTPLE